MRRSPKSNTPGSLLLKQAARLFPEGPERERFVNALVGGVGREPAIIVLQDHPAIQTFPKEWPEPWQPPFIVRLSEHFRPGQHPLYAKGAFYSLDFSSVFAASAMLEIKSPVTRVLDLCASPGGKSVFAWRAFKPELMLCNETIRKRANTLIDNLDRCKVESAYVWCADPSVYSTKYVDAFDLVLVDAPCSGQSLMAKGDPAPGAFTPSTIDMCVGRQRRILGNAAHTVRPGGHLLYMTCTFARKENEKMIEWFLEQHPEFRAVEVPHLDAYRSTYSDQPCYRLFPMSGLGAGAFTCLLVREGEAELPVIDLAYRWKYGDPTRREVPLPQPEEDSETVEGETPAAGSTTEKPNEPKKPTKTRLKPNERPRRGPRYDPKKKKPKPRRGGGRR